MSFYEIIDALLCKIESRFDQKCFKLYQSMETVLLAASKGDTQPSKDLALVTAHFGTDVNSVILRNQLAVLPE